MNPGEGYRLLEIGEIIREGDEFFEDQWKPRHFPAIGEPVSRFWLPTRRRIESAWMDAKVVKPGAGRHIWAYNGETVFNMITRFDEVYGVTHWRPVKPGEIPEPPPKPKTQEELDRESSEAWYRWNFNAFRVVSFSSLDMRTAYEAGRKDERKAKS